MDRLRHFLLVRHKQNWLLFFRFGLVGGSGVLVYMLVIIMCNKVGPHPMSKAQSIGFDATVSIKRSDFGVGAYVPKVSDEINIRITTEGSVPKVDAAK